MSEIQHCWTGRITPKNPRKPTVEDVPIGQPAPNSIAAPNTLQNSSPGLESQEEECPGLESQEEQIGPGALSQEEQCGLHEESNDASSRK